MKNNHTKIFVRIFCLILSVIMFAVFTMTALAEEKVNGKYYVKDVKLIYAESVDEAKTHVPKGYTLLEYDLNKGTEYVYDVYEVYMAYSVTQDPDEAITDIKMMNMNGGFAYSDYEEQLKNIDQSVRKLTDEFVLGAEAFAENYKKGTYGAKAAYKALSVLTVDEADGQSLADYLIYGNPSYDFYVKLVLNVHVDIMSLILSAFTMAVQGESGDTWLDRLSAVTDPDKIPEREGYWDKSCDTVDYFFDFFEIYENINHELYRTPAQMLIPDSSQNGNEEAEGPAENANLDESVSIDVSITGSEILYEVAHMALESYSFGNGVKFSDFFGDLDFAEEDLYCVFEVMTPAEYAMLHLSGPLSMILSTSMDADVYSDFVTRVDDIMKTGDTCSIWEGVNTDLFHSSIGITDEARRALAETKFEEELNNDGDSVVKSGMLTVALVASSALIVAGIGALGVTIGAGSIAAMLSAGVYSAAAVVVGVVGAVLVWTGIALAAAALVIVIVYAIIWISDWWEDHHPDYTEIPEYMYDYARDGSGNSQFVLYEAIKFQDGKNADVNAWEGKEWHAMYVSHNEAAGAPIEADFAVKYGDGRIGDGFAGLANFGEANAANLNRYADDDEVDGIFVTYRQKDLDGDYARRKYLSDVKLFRNENAEKCKIELENAKYVLYDYNLTPNSDYYTYLGYKTTNNKSQALTDIRIAENYYEYQYSAGGSGETYGASGNVGKNLTLYSTAISLFGTPILSDFLVTNDRNVPQGYEPVNLFSGGMAVNMNNDSEGDTKVYMYFLPSVTYTSGEEYLGGITTLYGGANVSSGFYNAVNELGYSYYDTIVSGSNSRNGGVVYTTTHNPYRAIYGITAYATGDEKGELFPEFISYGGVAYFKANRIIGSSTVPYADTGKATLDGRDAMIYIQGIRKNATPLKVEDVYVTDTLELAEEGFLPLSAIYSEDGKPANFSDTFDGVTRRGKQTVILKMTPLYVYVRAEAPKENNYVTNIFLTSKEYVLSGVQDDMEYDDVDNSYIISNLASKGASYWIRENLNLEEDDNITFLGYNKLHRDNSQTTVHPITDLVLYYAGSTDVKPESEIVLNRITYHIVSDINIFCPEDGTDSSCKRVYLYYTTNPAAGSPVMDIKIDKNAILNGWETVITQNEKALYTDMDAYSGSMWFIHMKRTVEDPKYIAEVVVGVGGNSAEAKAVLLEAGCDYMLDKDLNNGVGAHSDYIYIGYKRTSDPNKAIRDLRTTHNDEVESFAKNGATYYKIDGNLNSYTNIFADDIFLYYTRDAKAGTPLVSLGTSGSVANWTHGEGGRYIVTTVLNQNDKGSDLNDGALGDYIYLLQTRDKTDSNVLASMIGNGSLVAIIACVLLSVGAIIWIVIAQKKKRQKSEVKVDNQPKSDVKEGESQE